VKTWAFGGCDAENSSSYVEVLNTFSVDSVDEVGNGNMPKNDAIKRERNPCIGCC